ncbi:MAG: choice-of-anchor J domain-containing protein, partial [Muribaculaceae bacterium]|nr:choice-of-anchor J domain-containing protein [Muribaculaceae bacterium]
MKKLLLMLAGAVTAFAASANIVEDFATAEWLPTADANGAEQYTSTSTGIVYTMSHCKKGAYKQSTYLQVSGKDYQNEAYISFALPEGCSAVTFKTGTNASVNVTVTVTVGETTLGAANTKLDTKDADFTFAVPEGVSGDCKVLVTNKYNAQFQSITYVTDGGGEVNPPVVTPGEPLTSLNADFTGVSSMSQLEGWTSTVVLGDKPWYFSTYQGNTYAACTGYKGTSTDGYESWLITPALNVKDAASKTIAFETQCAYLGQDALKVYALSSADVATATRHELNATLPTSPASGYSEWVNSGDLSLEGYGDVVYVGFCYTSPVAEKYTTYCIDNVKFNAEGGEVTPPVVTPGESYTVAQVIALGVDANVADATVIGYIVGFVPGQKYADATFSADGASDTNLLLADSKTETDASKCIPVQLPKGDVRNALNLAENPGNLGAKATLTGAIEKYFGVPGLKSVTKFELEGTSPVNP